MITARWKKRKWLIGKSGSGGFAFVAFFTDPRTHKQENQYEFGTPSRTSNELLHCAQFKLLVPWLRELLLIMFSAALATRLIFAIFCVLLFFAFSAAQLPGRGNNKYPSAAQLFEEQQQNSGFVGLYTLQCGQLLSDGLFTIAFLREFSF